MRVYSFITVILSAMISFLCSCRHISGSDTSDNGNADSISVTLPTYDSDVYDQGHTEACWIYAMCACIEHEACLRGDSVVLSRQWLMSHLMEEQTLERYEILRNDGATLQEGGRGTLSMRGVGADVIRLIDTYGLVPYQHERSRINNSRVLQRRLALLTDNVINRRQSIRLLRERMRAMLPRFTVIRHNAFSHNPEEKREESFYYLSMRYTPQQFAESMMYYQRWNWFASDDDRPWGTRFALEVPDNRRYHEYVNIPMHELLEMVVESLRHGHAVYWEYGKEPSKQKQGGGAASDHAMAIVGMVGDKFLCLNSYGMNWGYKGCQLISQKYFIRHTCNVGIVDITQ